MRITNHEEIRQMFLRYDKDRSGFVTRENIMDLFRQINLPLENDLIDAVKTIIYIYISKEFYFIYLFRWLLSAQRTVRVK